jgi:SAM-dependent methyltransferase
MPNPWLSIPLADYEGHMAEVQQRHILDEVFEDVLLRHRPASLAILGCSGGSGLEGLDQAVVRRVVAIDFNPEYVAALRRRFATSMPALQAVCADLEDPGFELEPVDLIHAALILEYVDSSALLRRVRRWLKPGGVLSVVVQLQSENKAAVTPTRFRSLAALAPIMRLLAPRDLEEQAREAGFDLVSSRTMELPTGKRFAAYVFGAAGR